MYLLSTTIQRSLYSFLPFGGQSRAGKRAIEFLCNLRMMTPHAIPSTLALSTSICFDLRLAPKEHLHLSDNESLKQPLVINCGFLTDTKYLHFALMSTFTTAATLFLVAKNIDQIGVFFYRCCSTESPPRLADIT